MLPEPITLTNSELKQVLQRVAPKGKEYGAARICRQLANEHSVKSVRINIRSAVCNISDLVSKAINPRIERLGLYIACVKLDRPIKNQFGQNSGQMDWSFYRHAVRSEPCNNDLAAELRQDFADMAKEYPELSDRCSPKKKLNQRGLE